MVLIWLLAEMSSPAACCPPKLSALIWASCPVELNNQTCNNLTQPRMHPCAGPAAALSISRSVSLFLWPTSTSSVVQVSVQMANRVWLILLLLDIRICPPKSTFFKLVHMAWQCSRVPFHSLKLSEHIKWSSDSNNFYAFYILSQIQIPFSYPLPHFGRQ